MPEVKLSRRRRAILSGALLAACLLWGPSPTAQQPPPPTESPSPPPTRANPDDLLLILEGDQRPRQHLAFPRCERPRSLAPEGLDALLALEQTLRDDLALTGIFEIQGPQILSILELTGDRDRDFELYRSLGNEVALLCKAQTTQGGSRVVVEGRLYDLESGRQILGKLYRGELAVARRIAHTFSDEVVLYFTGRRGIALTTLAFVSNRDDPRHKELYLMDYDGFDQRRISGHKSITLSPSWSPAGDGMAYVSYFAGPPGVFRVEQATGAKLPVVSDDRHNMSPSISPDGRRVALSRSLGGNAEIFVAGINGDDLRRLTTSGGIDTNPAWSPTGRELAFTSSRSGTPQIYLMDAEGTNVRRITFEGNYNDGAAWHPDGTKIAYATREPGGGRFDIAVVDLVGLQSHRITEPPGSHEAPTYSPDGWRIAFESSRSGRRQVWVMGAAGQDPTQLTSEGQNYSPSWSGFTK